jgi:hypothetical protein
MADEPEDPRLVVHNLETKVVMLEAELQRERATAKAWIDVKDQQLESERRARESDEQINADLRRALEDVYEARLRALLEEVRLWRSDDVAGLRRWFEARLGIIDSTLAQLDGSSDLSETMRLRLDELRTERFEIFAVQAMLRER